MLGRVQEYAKEDSKWLDRAIEKRADSHACCFEYEFGALSLEERGPWESRKA
jgi:hypothetical protein